ncbi:unnamed protein product, partial [Schistosoma mattheei]
GQTAIQGFNTAFLRDTDRLNEFKITPNNRFQALQDLLKEEETTMEDNWKGIKEALIPCQEVLGLKKHHHKEWISIETLDKIKERKSKKTAINNSRTRAERIQAQAEYVEANKQVERSIRADKKKYVEELATTAEKAAREENMKQLYDTAKKLSGKYSKPERPVQDNEGKPITEIQQQRNRWAKYFEELLNRPAPMSPPDIEAAYTDLPIDVNPPNVKTIEASHYCQYQKNGRWIMKTSTSDGLHGMQWTAQNQLDDLDLADDLALLSHTHEQMQIKTASVAAVSASVGFSIHKRKTKVLKFKTENNIPITLDGETLEDVESFTYLGSIIYEQGSSDADVKARIGKARQQPIVGENKPDSSKGRNQEKALEVDRTHIEERIQLRHKTSPHMESSRPKEKRNTKEHIMPGNGDRDEKNEQELDRTRKEGGGQSGLENAGRRPMLH